MAVAAGPYTSDSDLEYTPFLTLLQELQSSPPAYVLLVSGLVRAENQSLTFFVIARAFHRSEAPQD